MSEQQALTLPPPPAEHHVELVPLEQLTVRCTERLRLAYDHEATAARLRAEVAKDVSRTVLAATTAPEVILLIGMMAKAARR